MAFDFPTHNTLSFPLPFTIAWHLDPPQILHPEADLDKRQAYQADGRRDVGAQREVEQDRPLQQPQVGFEAFPEWRRGE